MKQPDFLCVGAAKAGTTTLHETLRRHPSIWLPATKELHFFDDDHSYRKGISHYRAYFEFAPHGAMIGEVTPAYMTYDYVPERIYESLGPQTKLIFSLREPVARAYSEYLHNHRRGLVQGEFCEAMEREFRETSKSPWHKRHFSFLSRGHYAQQINRFLQYFPRKNMFFIVVEEDLDRNHRSTFARLFEFLGVDPIDVGEARNFNRAYVPRSSVVQRWLFSNNRLRRTARQLIRNQSLRTEIRRVIMKANAHSSSPELLDSATSRDLQIRYFREEISDLEQVIGRSLRAWTIE